MKRIYFDVTDIIDYASSNLSVSGIQRVQLRIIANLAEKHGANEILCSYFDRATQSMMEFDPRLTIRNDVEFDSELFLVSLGLMNGTSLFPSKPAIKSYLKKYSSNKPLRTLKKLDIYISAIFNRQRLTSLGFPDLRHKRHLIQPTPTQSIRALPEDSILVFLGANWTYSPIMNFGHAFKMRNGAVVQMVYDLIPYIRPDFCHTTHNAIFANWLEKIREYSTHFTCISDWTASDLRNYFGPDHVNYAIRTVSLAHEFSGFERNQIAPIAKAEIQEATTDPFVLCVGTIEIRKNGISLLRAWQTLLGKYGDRTPTLIFAGKMGWLIDDFQELLRSDSRLQRKIRIISSPTDSDLAYLYSHCRFTVYPSFYEGWGLPVGEAAWFGKFCIASNATSLPEVCGSLVDYVEPTDNRQIALAIERAAFDDKYLATKEAAIRGTTLRTWKDVADNLYSFLSEISHSVPAQPSIANHHKEPNSNLSGPRP